MIMVNIGIYNSNRKLFYGDFRWLFLTLIILLGACNFISKEDKMDKGIQMLKLSIEVRKREYSKDEIIVSTIHLTNVSMSPILINQRLLINFKISEGEIYFVIYDREGKECRFQQLIVPRELKDKDFIFINPGETISKSVDLSKNFGLKEPGEYTIQAFYRNTHDYEKLGQRAWKGEIMSNRISLKIKK